MSGFGRKRWAFAAGQVPSRSTGAEPEFTSRDQLAILNANDELANVRVTVVYANHGPVGPFRIGVAPRRVRNLRINDLIFPEAVRLDEPYGLDIESDVAVVVQLTRQDTRAAALASFFTTAFHDAEAD